MCVIVGDVESVANTRIVVAATSEERQVIVYANKVTLSGAPVAMVLPFYNGRGSGVEVIPTEPDDEALFEILKSVCTMKSRSGSLSANSRCFNSSAQRLEVLRSGSYRYSVAPTAADLYRADERIFRDLPADLCALVDQYEAARFGFVVCILDASAAYSPFAYLSDRMHDGALFVPTKHYHTHAPPAPTGFIANSKHGVDWDHEVYVVGLCAATLKCISMGDLAPTQHGYNSASTAEWKSSNLKTVFGAMGETSIAKYRLTATSGVPNNDMLLM